MNIKVALIAAAVIVGGAHAQDAPPARTPATVEDIVGLLQIGAADEEIVSHCESDGWPVVTERDLIVLRDAGAGRLLEKRLLRAFRGKSDLERLADDFEVYENKLPSKTEYRLLVPRKWRRTTTPTRLNFNEHEQEGLLLRRSLFLWFYEGRDWKVSNARALAHVAMSSCRKRFSRGGMRMGTATEEILIHKRTGREYPFFHAIVSDARTRVRSLLALAVRVDEKESVVTVAGFLTRIDDDSAAGRVAKDRLAEMISTLRFEAPKAPKKR